MSLTLHSARKAAVFAVLALCLTILPAVTPAMADEPRAACDTAAAAAERDWNLPVGLLAAVGTVESGLSEARGGPATSWPWSINAEGRGFYFPTKESAIAAVVALWGRGVLYIDVGCFQVDLGYHGKAFASLDQAFDPELNAQAAARILARERLSSSDWTVAVARYHSASPLLGGAYVDRVRAALPTARRRAWAALADMLAPAAYAVLLSPQARMVRVLTATDWAPPSPVVPTTVGSSPTRDPSPVLRNAHEPQIIYLGRPETLPRVVQASSASLPIPR